MSGNRRREKLSDGEVFRAALECLLTGRPPEPPPLLQPLFAQAVPPP